MQLKLNETNSFERDQIEQIEQIRAGLSILRKGRVSVEEENRFGDDASNEYLDIVYLVKNPKEISILMLDYGIDE